jgi:cell division protein FtsB
MRRVTPARRRSRVTASRNAEGMPKQDDAAALQSVRLRLAVWRRPKLTGRAMLVTAMALFLVVVLASPLQTYLNRRDALAASRQQRDQLNEQVAQLNQQSALWDDPAYVEREARARLQFVRPGDTLYTVISPDGSVRSPSPGDVGAVPRAGHGTDWSTTLWSSVKNADENQ